MRREGWLVFAAWVLAGALLSFSVLGAASIGFFVVPFALLAFWLALRLGRGWPEALGTISGAGAVSLLIAFLNRGTMSCADESLTLGPGETEITCGGLDPIPWLVAGLVLAAAGAIAYALARRGAHPGDGRPLLDAQDTST